MKNSKNIMVMGMLMAVTIASSARMETGPNGLDLKPPRGRGIANTVFSNNPNFGLGIGKTADLKLAEKTREIPSIVQDLVKARESESAAKKEYDAIKVKLEPKTIKEKTDTELYTVLIKKYNDSEKVSNDAKEKLESEKKKIDLTALENKVKPVREKEKSIEENKAKLDAALKLSAAFGPIDPTLKIKAASDVQNLKLQLTGLQNELVELQKTHKTDLEAINTASLPIKKANEDLELAKKNEKEALLAVTDLATKMVTARTEIIDLEKDIPSKKKLLEDATAKVLKVESELASAQAPKAVVAPPKLEPAPFLLEDEPETKKEKRDRLKREREESEEDEASDDRFSRNTGANDVMVTCMNAMIDAQMATNTAITNATAMIQQAMMFMMQTMQMNQQSHQASPQQFANLNQPLSSGPINVFMGGISDSMSRNFNQNLGLFDSLNSLRGMAGQLNNPGISVSGNLVIGGQNQPGLGQNFPGQLNGNGMPSNFMNGLPMNQDLRRAVVGNMGTNFAPGIVGQQQFPGQFQQTPGFQQPAPGFQGQQIQGLPGQNLSPQAFQGQGLNNMTVAQPL